MEEVVVEVAHHLIVMWKIAILEAPLAIAVLAVQELTAVLMAITTIVWMEGLAAAAAVHLEEAEETEVMLIGAVVIVTVLMAI